MLTTIRIQNIALIPAVEINFGDRFNVLTGETGAGKSIIIGSLNFILGDKLSTSVIRGGAEYARVTAVFDDTVITRTMWQNGRSEIRINDDIVTIKHLREIAADMVDIHGQHDTERLLTPKNHIDILDGFGRVSTTEYRAEYDQLKSIEQELNKFGDNDAERERLIDLYKYQIDEIEGANLSAAEEAELEQKITVMRNAGRVTENLNEIIANLDTADTAISHAGKKMTSVTALDTNLGGLAERLNAVSGELTDIIIGVREYLGGMDYTDADIDAAGERLDEIKKMKRKYGKTVDEIFAFLEKTRAEYDRLTGAGEKIAELRGQIAAQSAVVMTAGEKLSAHRANIAANMQTELQKHLADLGMPNAKFEVRFDKTAPKSNGIDDAEFYFSANLGEGVLPLSKIISGGEMSRLMLCIKTIANMDKNKTLIFDEIDTGISGLMGVAVAKKLEQLSKHSQIIVVTHLASIAATADTHFLIEKSVENNKTTTAVEPIKNEQRVNEIARIIGGGETAVAHAKSLLHY